MTKTKLHYIDRLLSFLAIMLLLAMCARPTLAQQPCAFDYLEQPRLEVPENYTRDTDTIHTIPLVVHVLHNAADPVGVGSNLSDAQVQTMINDLNLRLANNAEGDVGFRYCLAGFTPDGEPTNGINRTTYNQTYQDEGVSVGGTFGVPDADMKLDNHWPQENYYNLYVVTAISYYGSTGVTGYAYFPVNNHIDGIVIRYDRMFLPFTTLVHEVGHSLALYHTFEGANNCDAETDCTAQGDRVCDTNPAPLWYGCSNNCPASFPVAEFTNYMSYSGCRTDFTAGQIDRAHAICDAASVRLSQYQSNVCVEAPEPEPIVQCDDPCTNDTCEDVQDYTLCEKQPFCNVNCNTEEDYSVLPHPATGVACGGETHYLDQWYKFEATEAAYYELTLGGEFVSNLGASGNFGPYEGVKWQIARGTHCDSLEWICSSTCITNAPKCFCPGSPFVTGPGAWAGLCADAPCADPMELQPYWWILNPPDFPLDLDPPPGGYDPTRQEWHLLIPLAPGTYYLTISAFTPGDGAGGFYPSYGGGDFTICPIPAPLSTDPVLTNTGLTLSWTGVTATDWAVFRYDGVQWVEQLRTTRNEHRVTEGGYYMVAGSTGFSNMVKIDVRTISNQSPRFDVLGREGAKIWIK